jgi:hypothetical protein
VIPLTPLNVGKRTKVCEYPAPTGERCERPPGHPTEGEDGWHEARGMFGFTVQWRTRPDIGANRD